MWEYFKRFAAGMWQRPAFIFLTFLSWTLIAAYGAAFYWLEHDTNPTLKEPLDALYFAVTTVTTVGFGDVTPATTSGKLLAMLMMFTGTMIFVSFTALVSSAIVEAELEFRSEEIGTNPRVRENSTDI